MIPSMSVDPQGPFCFDCGSSDSTVANSSSIWEILSMAIQDSQGDCVVDGNCIV